ncbi:hypothetical protein BSZ32_00440 [Rubritalea profundi]|uniref:Uncharacterized protein n=1 Tax=Rubritalea profundi TaxID=1658618 RepID=A0A2S7TWL8_9BACT|nr:hypothetical protein BSZ32_00440 [Rubritalea profundi]
MDISLSPIPPSTSRLTTIVSTKEQASRQAPHHTRPGSRAAKLNPAPVVHRLTNFQQKTLRLCVSERGSEFISRAEPQSKT